MLNAEQWTASVAAGRRPVAPVVVDPFLCRRVCAPRHEAPLPRAKRGRGRGAWGLGPAQNR